LSTFQPDSLLGFRNLEHGGNQTDQPGFIECASGVATALLSAATGIEPGWDRVFVLSECAMSKPSNKPPLYLPLDFAVVRAPLLTVEAYLALQSEDEQLNLLKDQRALRAIAVQARRY
jgi:hypothetical protein